MKHIVVFSLFFLIFGCSTQDQFDQTKIRKEISLEETSRIMNMLASDQMLGRDSRSGGYAKAADFVGKYLDEYGIKPFYSAYRDSLVTDSLVSYNIVGQIGTYEPTRKTILIGAHLDHVGVRTTEKDSIFNGANDNATGVTAVMQIGRFLAQHKWNQNILIAFFADEEKGLKGAFHLAERMNNENLKISYMVNFEMIGTELSTGKNQVYMTGYHRSNMAQVMNEISPEFVQFLPEAKQFNLFKRSDNYAFFERLDIPAQTLSSFDFKNYNFYHKAQDEVSELDLENMNQIIGTAAFTLVQMLEKEVVIEMSSESEKSSSTY